ncbi:adenosylmethionine--8-amino-7-oxononanoate transaminase [Corynebacterium heidelbergense]|uniref:adenosylmethionine--8-amino-7-oxononanoate transaminase n=1 Tax=Corynebacterium heidelbergense TaxID=2055947 RepID=UPI001EE6991A|nr:adenosylmethionine--8-amino-7-oxononanoate transaminase [Corynebacterium heidelbergense]WCZ37548.1 Adenosylmethionine-8-amino-7-oxononanoate aminotransferase [Corynebacterium heidelbergense]
MDVHDGRQHWAPDRIRAADQAHVWHPYSPRFNAQPQLPVRSARGTRLTLADGREVLDGMSSWWAACHGHSHPHIVAAAHRQIDTMSHVMFGGLTHQPAAELAERLLGLVNGPRALGGPPLTSVFYSDSGSVAVEVALKMALQYQRGMGRPQRDRFLTWRGGYYGDTQGPMGVCDPDGGMHRLWRGTLTPQVFVPAPPGLLASPRTIADYLEDIAATIHRHNAATSPHGIAGIIVEPLVQGAGGMRFHHPELISGLRRICEETGTLLIADEIATGFGRTGESFACFTAGVRPDILCVGKALTGGFMSFAATLAGDRVARAVDSEPGGGALMHGPTFMGNPLACAVSLAALDLYESGYWRPRVRRFAQLLEEEMAPLRGAPGVVDVRVLGAIGVVEMLGEVELPRMTQTLVDMGVWLRPFGRLLYTMPPFICSDEEIRLIGRAMRQAVTA